MWLLIFLDSPTFCFNLYVAVIIYSPFILGEQFKFAKLNLHIFLDNIEIPSKQLIYAE